MRRTILLLLRRCIDATPWSWPVVAILFGATGGKVGQIYDRPGHGAAFGSLLALSTGVALTRWVRRASGSPPTAEAVDN